MDEQHLSGDVLLDGRRFWTISGADSGDARESVLVEHWFEELTRLVPAKVRDAVRRSPGAKRLGPGPLESTPNPELEEVGDGCRNQELSSFGWVISPPAPKSRSIRRRAR